MQTLDDSEKLVVITKVFTRLFIIIIGIVLLVLVLVELYFNQKIFGNNFESTGK